MAFAEDMAEEMKDSRSVHETTVLHLERTRWDYNWRQTFKVRANTCIPFPVPRQYLFRFHWKPTCPVQRELTLTA